MSKTMFGTLLPTGEVVNKMEVDLHTLPSSDPLAFMGGIMSGKEEAQNEQIYNGRKKPINHGSKYSELSQEYLRGFLQWLHRQYRVRLHDRQQNLPRRCHQETTQFRKHLTKWDQWLLVDIPRYLPPGLPAQNFEGYYYQHEVFDTQLPEFLNQWQAGRCFLKKDSFLIFCSFF